MNIIKCKKKPPVIKAIQLCWDTLAEVCFFVDIECFDTSVYLDDKTLEETDECTNTIGLRLITPNGIVLVKQGDYIIKNENGKFYSCTEDEFKKNYEII